MLLVNRTPFKAEKISPRAEVKPGTARSVGQHLTTEQPGLLSFKDSYGII